MHRLVSIDEEPGYGFVTLSPWREDGQAEEMIVPVGAIAAVRLTPMEEHPPFGFAAGRSSYGLNCMSCQEGTGAISSSARPPFGSEYVNSPVDSSHVTSSSPCFTR